MLYLIDKFFSWTTHLLKTNGLRVSQSVPTMSVLFPLHPCTRPSQPRYFSNLLLEYFYLHLHLCRVQHRRIYKSILYLKVLILDLSNHNLRWGYPKLICLVNYFHYLLYMPNTVLCKFVIIYHSSIHPFTRLVVAYIPPTLKRWVGFTLRFIKIYWYFNINNDDWSWKSFWIIIYKF